MTKKIIFFTASNVTTEAEQLAIAKLNAAAERPYEVVVVNGAANSKCGETDRLIPADYAAGTIPELYEDYEAIDPDELPDGPLAENQAIVEDGDEFVVEGGTVSVEVTGGVPTFTFTAAAG